MAAADELRTALVAGDIAACRRIWAATNAHLPQPKTKAEAEQIMHVARTATRSIPLRIRAWSHRWLTERGLPSQLPDNLRPRAERLYPRIAAGVGISIQARSPLMHSAVPIIRKAMESAVLEAEADGKLGDSTHVKARMAEARERETRALFGKPGEAK